MKHLFKTALAPAIILLSLLFVAPAMAQTMSFAQKLLASDGSASDNFGGSVGLDGNTIVIGARNNGYYRGAAYVFTRSGGVWTEQQKLTANDAAAWDLFGESVSMDGDTMVISARHDDDNGPASGSAYVFTRSDGVWTEQQKLTTSDAAENDNFGYSVALDGDTAVIGSIYASAYVFTRSGGIWTEQQKLVSSDGEDLFDFKVAVDGDTAVICAYGSDDDTLGSGAAFVFTRSGDVWTEQQRLTPTDDAHFHLFCDSVDLDADTAVIGAPGDGDTGSAYVFTRSGDVWTEQQKLTASDGEAADNFGRSVAVRENGVLIGSSGHDPNYAGKAYLFNRSAGVWTEKQKFTAGEGGDLFGRSVDVDDGVVVIGATLDDDLGEYSGSAYIFAQRTLLGVFFCFPTCEPFGRFGCDNVVFRCYLLPVVVVIFPIIIIWSFWFFRRRQRS